MFEIIDNFEDFLNKKLTFTNETNTNDGAGSWTTTTTTFQLDCYIELASSNIIDTYYKKGVDAKYLIIMKYDSRITSKTKVTVNNIDYQVIFDDNVNLQNDFIEAVVGNEF